MEAKPRIWFYQSRDFVPHHFKTVPRNLDRSRVHYAEKFAPVMQQVLHYFDEVTFERAGTLMGEYLVTSGSVLMRRDGLLVKVGLSNDDTSASRLLDERCIDGDFCDMLNELGRAWDSLPALEHVPIISHPYGQNYYHWSLEAVPGQRLFGQWPDNRVLVPAVNLQRLFQRDLLARTAEGRLYVLFTGAVVRNPILASELMSEESVWWLRRTAGISVPSGRRRIYLRRSTKGSRSGMRGGISEAPEFLDFLKENSFETVDFGDKEMGVDEQAHLLDGAAVILAPHGAALTNLVYLNPPLKIIEVIGARTARAVFLHISSLCGLDHHVVLSTDYDAQGDVVVDVGDLREALAASDPPRPA